MQVTLRYFLDHFSDMVLAVSNGEVVDIREPGAPPMRLEFADPKEAAEWKRRQGATDSKVEIKGDKDSGSQDSQYASELP